MVPPLLVGRLHRNRNPAGGLIAHNDSRQERLLRETEPVPGGHQGRDHGGAQVDHREALAVVQLQAMGVEAVHQRRCPRIRKGLVSDQPRRSLRRAFQESGPFPPVLPRAGRGHGQVILPARFRPVQDPAGDLLCLFEQIRRELLGQISHMLPSFYRYLLSSISPSSPRSKQAMFRNAAAIIARKESAVTPAICGVRITFSTPLSG